MRALLRTFSILDSISYEMVMALSRLKSDSTVLAYSGLTPERLPELVENNPNVATEVLLLLMPSSEISRFVLRILASKHAFPLSPNREIELCTVTCKCSSTCK